MEFQEIAVEIAVLFLIMLIGAYGGKSGFISQEASETINKVVVNITNPCLIMFGMQRDFSTELLHNALMLIAAGFAGTGIFVAISELWGRFSKQEDRGRLGTEQFLFTFGNQGFLGIPIMQVIFGSLGIFYVVMFGLAQNLLMFSYGYKIFGNETGWGVFRQCLNNGLFATILSFVLFLGGVKLPYLLYQPINLVGNLTVPLILLSVGSSISRIPLRELFRSRTAWWITLVKLAVCPLVFTGIFLLIPAPRDVAVVAVTLFSMPAALLSCPMSEMNGGDLMLANKTVILSNLLVMFSMPCVIWLLNVAGIF